MQSRRSPHWARPLFPGKSLKQRQMRPLHGLHPPPAIPSSDNSMEQSSTPTLMLIPCSPSCMTLCIPHAGSFVSLLSAPTTAWRTSSPRPANSLARTQRCGRRRASRNRKPGRREASAISRARASLRDSSCICLWSLCCMTRGGWGVACGHPPAHGGAILNAAMAHGTDRAVSEQPPTYTHSTGGGPCEYSQFCHPHVCWKEPKPMPMIPLPLCCMHSTRCAQVSIPQEV